MKEFILDSFKPENFWVAATVFVALLVPLINKLFNFINRTKVKILYNKYSERCLRKATVINDNIQDTPTYQFVERNYFRLIIKCTNGLAKNIRVRVDLLDQYLKEVPRFEPCLLRWVIPKEKIDLVKGEYEYINLISQVINEPGIKNRIRIEIQDTTPRGVAWDRPLKKYILKVSAFGENFSPVIKYFEFKPALSFKLLTSGNLKEIKI
jgi:hypothetical protein